MVLFTHNRDMLFLSVKTIKVLSLYCYFQGIRLFPYPLPSWLSPFLAGRFPRGSCRSFYPGDSRAYQVPLCAHSNSPLTLYPARPYGTVHLSTFGVTGLKNWFSYLPSTRSHSRGVKKYCALVGYLVAKPYLQEYDRFTSQLHTFSYHPACVIDYASAQKYLP